MPRTVAVETTGMMIAVLVAAPAGYMVETVDMVEVDVLERAAVLTTVVDKLVLDVDDVVVDDPAAGDVEDEDDVDVDVVDGILNGVVDVVSGRTEVSVGDAGSVVKMEDVKAVCVVTGVEVARAGLPLLSCRASILASSYARPSMSCFKVSDCWKYASALSRLIRWRWCLLSMRTRTPLDETSAFATNKR